MGTETLRPSATGDSYQLTGDPATGTSSWQNVDDTTTDEGTSQNYSNTANYFDLYNISNSALSTETITNVTLWGNFSRYNASANKGYLGLKSGATTYWGDELTFESAYTNFSRSFDVDPNGSVAWTVSAINALQIGAKVAATNGGLGMSQIYIIVTYTTGWANIAKVNGIASADMAKVLDVAVASIAKIYGVAV
jgi:hypothetical protein